MSLSGVECVAGVLDPIPNSSMIAGTGLPVLPNAPTPLPQERATRLLSAIKFSPSQPYVNELNAHESG